MNILCPCKLAIAQNSRNNLFLSSSVNLSEQLNLHNTYCITFFCFRIIFCVTVCTIMITFITLLYFFRHIFISCNLVLVILFFESFVIFTFVIQGFTVLFLLRDYPLLVLTSRSYFFRFYNLRAG